jgi:hypothetical protein
VQMERLKQTIAVQSENQQRPGGRARTKPCHTVSRLIWTLVSSVVGGIKVGKGVGGLIAQCIKATD